MTLGGERNRSTWHRILDNKKGSGFVLIPAHSINFCASYNSVITSYLCICAPLYHRAGAVFKHVPSTVYCSLLHNNNKQLTTKTPLSPPAWSHWDGQTLDMPLQNRDRVQASHGCTADGPRESIQTDEEDSYVPLQKTVAPLPQFPLLSTLNWT